MKRSVDSLWVSALAAGLCVVLLVNGCGTEGTGGGGGALAGNWRVIKSIVGGSTAAPIDWSTGQPVGDGSGVKDGDSIFEDWTITEEGGGYKVSSGGASAYGTPTADGAYFEWEGPDPALALWGVQGTLKVTIDVHLSPNGELWGGQVFQRHVADGIGVLTPAPPESWTFRATRK